MKEIIKAINELHEFLECDLWTKFDKQDKYMKNHNLWRTDVFKKEEEMYNYLKEHFDLLKNEVRKCLRQMETKRGSEE